MTYLLDTNACIDFIVGRSDPLRARINRHLAAGLTMSAISYAELRVGARRSDRREADERLLDILVTFIRVRNFDAAAAAAYGSLARQIGVKRRRLDRLIAAHAKSTGSILVTNNEADFADIPDLRIENWTR